MTGAFLLHRDDVLQTFMPLFTSGGVRAFTCALWAGCTIVFDPALEIDAVVERMARGRTTRYVGTSDFYIFLLARAAERPIALSHITDFFFGGYQPTADVIRLLAGVFPGLPPR